VRPCLFPNRAHVPRSLDRPSTLCSFALTHFMVPPSAQTTQAQSYFRALAIGSCPALAGNNQVKAGQGHPTTWQPKLRRAKATEVQVLSVPKISVRKMWKMVVHTSSWRSRAACTLRVQSSSKEFKQIATFACKLA